MKNKIRILKILLTSIACLIVSISISLIIFYSYRIGERNRLDEIINNCFEISEYSSTNATFTTKEPIERYFKLCMDFHGFNSNEYSFN